MCLLLESSRALSQVNAYITSTESIYDKAFSAGYHEGQAAILADLESCELANHPILKDLLEKYRQTS